MDELTDDFIFELTTYLDPRDFANLAKTCKRFGWSPATAAAVAAGDGKKKKGKRKRKRGGRATRTTDDDAGGSGKRQWSLMEEAARKIVEAEKADEDWGDSGLLRRRGAMSWMAVHRRSHPLRASLVFYRIIGEGAYYVNKDLSRVRARRFLEYPEGDLWGGPTAVCQEVMKEGRHYAEFTVIHNGRYGPGIVRPINGWGDDMPIIMSDTRSHYFGMFRAKRRYQFFCNEQRQSESPGYDGDKHYYVADRHMICVFEKDDVIGLLLDLDEGTMTLYHNGSCLGIKERGLSGHYRWAISLDTKAGIRPGVKIRRAPFPGDS